jgi:hypothetical protein
MWASAGLWKSISSWHCEKGSIIPLDSCEGEIVRFWRLRRESSSNKSVAIDNRLYDNCIVISNHVFSELFALTRHAEGPAKIYCNISNTQWGRIVIDLYLASGPIIQYYIRMYRRLIEKYSQLPNISWYNCSILSCTSVWKEVATWAQREQYLYRRLRGKRSDFI